MVPLKKAPEGASVDLVQQFTLLVGQTCSLEGRSIMSPTCGSFNPHPLGLADIITYVILYIKREFTFIK